MVWCWFWCVRVLIIQLKSCSCCTALTNASDCYTDLVKALLILETCVGLVRSDFLGPFYGFIDQTASEMTGNREREERGTKQRASGRTWTRGRCSEDKASAHGTVSVNIQIKHISCKSYPLCQKSCWSCRSLTGLRDSLNLQQIS